MVAGFRHEQASPGCCSPTCLGLPSSFHRPGSAKPFAVWQLLLQLLITLASVSGCGGNIPEQAFGTPAGTVHLYSHGLGNGSDGHIPDDHARRQLASMGGGSPSLRPQPIRQFHGLLDSDVSSHSPVSSALYLRRMRGHTLKLYCSLKNALGTRRNEPRRRDDVEPPKALGRDDHALLLRAHCFRPAFSTKHCRPPATPGRQHAANASPRLPTCVQSEPAINSRPKQGSAAVDSEEAGITSTSSIPVPHDGRLQTPGAHTPRAGPRAGQRQQGQLHRRVEGAGLHHQRQREGATREVPLEEIVAPGPAGRTGESAPSSGHLLQQCADAKGSATRRHHPLRHAQQPLQGPGSGAHPVDKVSENPDHARHHEWPCSDLAVAACAWVTTSPATPRGSHRGLEMAMNTGQHSISTNLQDEMSRDREQRSLRQWPRRLCPNQQRHVAADDSQVHHPRYAGGLSQEYRRVPTPACPAANR